MEWLESLENAHSYRDAIRRVVTGEQSTPTNILELLFATAAVHRFGYSLPFQIADEIVGRSTLEQTFDEESQLGQIGYLDERGVRLRSGAFSNFVWSLLNNEIKYKISILLVRKLAPLVVPKSISMRSTPYLIVRSLMDHDNVKADLNNLAEHWYSELEPCCGWNARFWEQRALLASDNLASGKQQEGLAYSYAKKAVSILEKDSFPHTTLGKICVKIGITRRDSVGVERFWEGVNELKTSRTLATEKNLEWEHPYVTFFTYSLQALKLAHFSGETEKISMNWEEWMQSAKKSKQLIFDHEGNSMLDDFQRKFLLTMVIN